MKLQILNNKGVFEIHGHFIEEHADEVRSYFNNLLDTYYEIVICLKEVQQIDKFGISVLEFILKKSTKRCKTVFVLGEKNKRIRKKFKKQIFTRFLKMIIQVSFLKIKLSQEQLFMLSVFSSEWRELFLQSYSWSSFRSCKICGCCCINHFVISVIIFSNDISIGYCKILSNIRS